MTDLCEYLSQGLLNWQFGIFWTLWFHNNFARMTRNQVMKRKKNHQKLERWQSRQLPRQLNLQTVLRMLHICMLYLIFFCIFESCLKIFKMQHSGCWWFVVVLNIRTFLHRSQMPFILWCMRCFDTEADYPSRCVQMTTQDLRVSQCLGDKSKVLLFWNRKLYTINQFLSGPPELTVLDALDFATILRGWWRFWWGRTTKSCAEASAG